MTSLASTKPSSFRRSSENTKDGDVQAAAAVKRIVQLEAEDPRGFDWEDGCRERERLECGLGARSSGLVTKPSFEDLYGRMQAEDTSRYDLEGRVH